MILSPNLFFSEQFAPLFCLLNWDRVFSLTFFPQLVRYRNCVDAIFFSYLCMSEFSGTFTKVKVLFLKSRKKLNKISFFSLFFSEHLILYVVPVAEMGEILLVNPPTV